MGTFGGKQPGAGRPKAQRTLDGEMLRDYIAGEIQKHKAPIIAALIGKAEDGDVAAVKELFDRAHGKAVQPTDITSNGESINRPLESLTTDELIELARGNS